MHKYAHTHTNTHMQPKIMCFAGASKAATPSSTSILQFICKLHVSCYLWRDSRELCHLSSFSLIIAVMRIKALEWALLVGFLIHMHEGGRSQSLLCHPSYLEIRWDAINICDGPSEHHEQPWNKCVILHCYKLYWWLKHLCSEWNGSQDKYKHTRVSQRNVTPAKTYRCQKDLECFTIDDNDCFPRWRPFFFYL